MVWFVVLQTGQSQNIEATLQEAPCEIAHQRISVNALLHIHDHPRPLPRDLLHTNLKNFEEKGPGQLLRFHGNSILKGVCRSAIRKVLEVLECIFSVVAIEKAVDKAVRHPPPLIYAGENTGDLRLVEIGNFAFTVKKGDIPALPEWAIPAITARILDRCWGVAPGEVRQVK